MNGPGWSLEISLKRAKAPRLVRLAKLRRWRWDVTRYLPAEGDNPGVFDRRIHVSASSGYTFTRWGALSAIGGFFMGGGSSDSWTEE